MKYFILAITNAILVILFGCSKSEDSINSNPSIPERVYIYSAVSSPTNSESITVKNNSGTQENLSGWTLGDINDPTAYSIPNGTIMSQGATKTFGHTTLGFQINDSNETLYLKNQNGGTIDTWSN